MVTVGRKLTRSRRCVVCRGRCVQVQTPGTNILNIGELWPAPASTGRSVWEERRLICTAWERREGTFTVTINQILSGSSSRARAR